MYQDLYNYLIDARIEINENDTLLTKIQKLLLKYKKIIAIILLITLLMVGYLCKLDNLFLNNSGSNSNYNYEKTCILYGGDGEAPAAHMPEAPKAPEAPEAPKAPDAPDKPSKGGDAAAGKSGKKGALNYKSKYYAKGKENLGKGAAALKSGIKNAPANLKAFGARRAEDIKELAPWFYGIIYSISLALLSFLIFVPVVGFVIVGLICFALLKTKISYIKSL